MTGPGSVSIRWRTRSRHDGATFAIPFMELFLVVLLVGSLGAFAGAIQDGQRARRTASLARRFSQLLSRARAAALVDGKQRRVRCGPLGCFSDVARGGGMESRFGWSADGDGVATGSSAVVWAIDRSPPGSADGEALPGPYTGTTALTIHPDGTASDAVIFLCDASRGSRHQVQLFGASGQARVLDHW